LIHPWHVRLAAALRAQARLEYSGLERHSRLPSPVTDPYKVSWSWEGPRVEAISRTGERVRRSPCRRRKRRPDSVTHRGWPPSAPACRMSHRTAPNWRVALAVMILGWSQSGHRILRNAPGSDTTARQWPAPN